MFEESFFPYLEKTDPEIALRSASSRFRDRVLHAERLAQDDGRNWKDLDEDARLTYYARAAYAERGVGPEGEPAD